MLSDLLDVLDGYGGTVPVGFHRTSVKTADDVLRRAGVDRMHAHDGDSRHVELRARSPRSSGHDGIGAATAGSTVRQERSDIEILAFGRASTRTPHTIGICGPFPIGTRAVRAAGEAAM